MEHARTLQIRDGALNSKPKEGEVWRVTEDGVMFELTRYGGLIPDLGLDLLSLHIKGIGRERIVENFTNAFGKPLSHFPPRKNRRFYSYKWDTSKIPGFASPEKATS